MNKTDLPNDIEQLKQLLIESQQAIHALQHKYADLLEKFRLAQKNRFGKSSEKNPDQGELFNEAEDVLEKEAEAQQESDDKDQTEIPAHTRKKPKRAPLPKDLPRETIYIDVDDKKCDQCDCEMNKIDEISSEKLEFVPASIKVIETVRAKYACNHCEKNDIKTPFKTAPLPPHIIPKGIASPSLLAEIICNKYLYALPLYRQEKLFKQYKIDLNRSTMSDWMKTCAGKLDMLYERMRKILLEQAYVRADETRVNVIKSEKDTCFMWLYCSGADSPDPNSTLKNIVLFDFQESRQAIHPVQFLEGFSGVLQADGYSGYQSVVNTTLVGCMAHARRKFKDAEAVLPKGTKSAKIQQAISYFKKLYAIEKKLKGVSDIDKRTEIRQSESKPILEDLKTWLDKAASFPIASEKLKTAINYCLNQWDKLIKYADNGLIDIDNNRAERAIKPFVIGRKNWLFSYTANGAKISATLYSIVETAKANGLEPHQYLTQVFKELPLVEKDQSIDHLLPWNITLPE